MHVHFLGIGGTLMGSLSLFAKSLGYKVTGQDQKIYPPISTQLAKHGIEIYEGYELTKYQEVADLIVVGNVMKRGMPIVEQLLISKQRFMSGPQFLANYVLTGKHILAVTGTHGKTTTSSMLAWILEYAGYNPSFLIGGIPNNFEVSARLTSSKYFVIEGDEYDCAFFDKRAKFLHYSPSTLIINNLEYDHADIFPNVAAIQEQFHHLLRIIPGNGCIIVPFQHELIDAVIARGCWSLLQRFGISDGDWQVTAYNSKSWPVIGEFNHLNAVAAIAAAAHIGIKPAIAEQALLSFTGVKRRCEVVAQFNNIKIYSDFAHHPTAIAVTLQAIKANLTKKQRLLAIIEMGSNTMRSTVHKAAIVTAITAADLVYFYHRKPIELDLQAIMANQAKCRGVFQDESLLVKDLLTKVQDNDQLVLMSNGALADLQQKLITGIGAWIKQEI